VRCSACWRRALPRAGTRADRHSPVAVWRRHRGLRDGHSERGEPSCRRCTCTCTGIAWRPAAPSVARYSRGATARPAPTSAGGAAATRLAVGQAGGPAKHANLDTNPNRNPSRPKRPRPTRRAEHPSARGTLASGHPTTLARAEACILAHLRPPTHA
jgi:hypothetical protein